MSTKVENADISSFEKSDELLSKYSARVKEVYIEIPDYKFYHSPSPLNKHALPMQHQHRFEFIGRERVLKDLEVVLTEVESKSGSYLVTGFRGMGKTSLVRKVIEKINKEHKQMYDKLRYVPIEISLAQDEIRDVDVLRLIARRLQEEIYYHSKNIKILNNFRNSVIRVFNKNPHKSSTSKADRNQESIKNILDDLYFLNERISASVSVENGIQQAWNGGLQAAELSGSYQNKRDYKKTMAYTPANAKEIEMELIRVLENIDNVRNTKKGRNLPEILFIFDELDKIEPNYSAAISEKEAEDPSYESVRNSFLADRIRRRQDIVGRLLANLKNLLNVSRAKYIFIGGREMYDASLADIADRDTFYGSIFSRIFYVDSFLRDESRSSRGNLSGLAEQQLCSVLIPRDNNKDSQDVNLREYRKYLESAIFKGESKDLGPTVKIQKVITVLQNFTVYLTYRSSGTPRKITNLIENYIVKVDETQLQSLDREELVVYNKSNNKTNSNEPKKRHWFLKSFNKNTDDQIIKPSSRLFLRFGYKAQFDIGLTATVYRPYLIHTSRFLKLASDSLLFSTSFIIDHLLKFHPFAFSWNNLEVIPEIITVNKAPYLRQYIEDILNFYMGFAIRNTNTGIFKYKFYSKFASELKFISKMSDLSNAAFNFTLDESLLIKRYYKRKLKEMELTYGGYKNDLDKSNHIYSIGFLHSLIGDLHFYDKEYDDAIISYIGAVQRLRSIIPADINEQQAIYLILTEQKLALTYEKMQMYEMAFTIYKRLIRQLPVLFGQSTRNKPSSFVNDQYSFLGLNVLHQPYLSILFLLEKFRTDGFTDINLSDTIQMFKKTLIGIRAKLSKKEGAVRSRLIFTIKYTFYYNIGSILFYKNQNFIEKFLGVKDRANSPDVYPFASRIDEIKSLPCSSLSAFDAYTLSLYWVSRRFEIQYNGQQNDTHEDTTQFQELALLKIIKELLYSNRNRELTGAHYDEIGNILSKTGDAFLTMLPCKENRHPSDFKLSLKIFKALGLEKQNHSSQTEIEAIYSAYEELVKQNRGNADMLDINAVIGICYFAFKAYVKAGKTYSAIFMLKKVLWITHEYLSGVDANESYQTCEEEGSEVLKSLRELIIEPVISMITKSGSSSARLQILKYKDTLGYERDHKDSAGIYTSLSTNGELREVLMLYSLIEIKLCNMGILQYDKLSIKYTSLLISPYSVTSYRFTRLLELQYRVDLNYRTFIASGFNKIIDDLKNTQAEKAMRSDEYAAYVNENCKLIGCDGLEDYKGKDRLEFLIADSIFCLSEMLRNTNIFGVGYLTSFSWMGYLHYKMAKWCDFYRTILRAQSHSVDEKSIEDRDKSIYKLVKRMISQPFMFHLETNYYNELALSYFERARQLHTQGAVYKSHIKNMYYAEDDLNDNFSHFLTALERFRINLGTVDRTAQKISEVLQDSKVYKAEKYGLV
ncbi:MAG: ATP-binding protein [Bacteroidia bacterium]|nr:ATP-binding protein [Bacteroidia bacterium]